MERKIGEIFLYKGEWYQCIKQEFPICCGSCDFYNGGFKKCDDDTVGECAANHRDDRYGVGFKKLEKVGKPFAQYIHGDNRSVIMQEYKAYDNNIDSTSGVLMYVTDYKYKKVAIEIKQNQEDMEEKIQHYDCFFDKEKSNLKPFDLKAAKDGKSVCTRDGHKVRIICFDHNPKNDNYPILALIQYKDDKGNMYEEVNSYTNEGKHSYFGSYENDKDLMMLSEKHEGWVNLYKENIYDTKEEALRHKAPGTKYIDTIKVEWQE